MKRKKIIKILLTLLVFGVITAGSIVYYQFNQPHRNVQESKTDFSFSSSQIVREYLTNLKAANEKYLDEEGNSKILEISGKVAEISEDFNNQKVIILKSESDSAGVSCTFTPETNATVNQIKIGEPLSVKGVIRSGASYDKDLGMYENVILEKCSLVSK
jgi:hypothetical protein